jgi:putative transposase
MREQYPTYSLAFICSLFGKTRHAYYDSIWRTNNDILRQELVIKFVRELRKEQPKIGTRKLHHLIIPMLKEHKISIGRDELFELLEQYKMLIRRRKRKNITTDSKHWLHKYPNLIEYLEPDAPCQLWVSDITYIKLSFGFCYLSLITDAYSHKIVGHSLQRDLSSHGPLEALQIAISNRQNYEYTLIHHSDRGCQYCSKDYVEMLLKGKIAISMTRNGDPYENAIAERVNGILKSEFGLDKAFANYEEALAALTIAIKTYNKKRPHLSCDLLTPEEAEKQSGLLKKRWKKYVKKKPP